MHRRRSALPASAILVPPTPQALEAEAVHAEQWAAADSAMCGRAADKVREARGWPQGAARCFERRVCSAGMAGTASRQ